MPKRRAKQIIHSKESNILLDRAISAGQINQVRRLVRQGACPKRKHLVDAASQGNAAMVKVLMEHGRPALSTTSCQDALVNAIRKKHTQVVCVLLKAGVDPNFDNNECYPGEVPLHMAVRSDGIEMVKSLLDHGANVNAVDAKGRTALYDHTESLIIRLLIQRGANPNHVDHSGLSPLHLVCSEGDLDAARELKGANPNAFVNDTTPLHFACAGGHLELIRCLIEQAGANPCPVTTKPLFAFAASSLPPKDLIDLGLDPWQRDVYGGTALHFAMTASDIHEIARINFVDELLCVAPNLANQRNHAQETALHLAIKHENMTMVRLLVQKHNADLMARDSFGRIPAFQAVFYGSILNSVLNLMKEKRADMNAQDNNGWTMLHWAVFHDYSAETSLLLSHGVNCDIKNNHGRLALHMVGYPYHVDQNVRSIPSYTDYDISGVLRNGGARTECLSSAGTMKIHHYECLQNLLGRTANALAQDKDGNLPFFLAATSSRTTETFTMLQAAVSQGLFGNNQPTIQEDRDAKRRRKESTEVGATKAGPVKKVKNVKKRVATKKRRQTHKPKLARGTSSSANVSTPTASGTSDTHVDPFLLEFGARIAIYWPLDEMYYSGHVIATDGQGGIEIKYDDGYTEWRGKDKRDRIKKINKDDNNLHAIKQDIANIKVGDRVGIWWPMERAYYDGTVTKVKRSRETLFFVEYDDGDTEWLNLVSRQYRRI